MATGDAIHVQIKLPSQVNNSQLASVFPSWPAESNMGSVSSLISGQNLQGKQCKALEYGNIKATHLHKLLRQQDGLLRFDTSHQASNKGSKANSECEKTEDFFYISISKTNGLTNTGKLKKCTVQVKPQKGGPVSMDVQEPPPTLVPFSGQLDKSTGKNIVRPTVLKVMAPRNGNADVNCISGKLANQKGEFQGNLSKVTKHSEVHDAHKQKHTNHSGTLSDSGRNSMSSLPTPSTEPVSTANLLSRFGGSAHHISQGAGSLDSILNTGSCSTSTPESREWRASHSTNLPQPQKEAGWEAQDVKATAVLRLDQDKQEVTSLTQSGDTKTKAPRNQHQLVLLQLSQLQQDKAKLQEDFTQLLREHDSLNAKCKAYQREQTELAPKLEETKWEVCQKSGEISLLKQQLKDSQAELMQKSSELLSLKSQLREAKGKLSAQEQAVEELQNRLQARDRELEVCENERQRMKNAADLLREKVGLQDGQILQLKHKLAGCKELDIHATQADPTACHGGCREPARRKPEQDSVALREELASLQAQLEQEKKSNWELSCNFRQERLVWQLEKQQVIEYQKQLQQSYTEVLHQNQSLQTVIQQLSTELKVSNLRGSEKQSTDIHYQEIVATAL
ncbi:leucine zipper putative tumor suppressor 1-like [Chiloscyllium plagiosum]|uniref:leucine zipper putative tumor suppressor 1-like n=1 Tax=Chiloscyllium plagiosum TaxID=36176 RepID=UPI001CB7E51F|nr:leucine zipper putative tumor suppressor 1-like [Chiloscyllium plagiosum]XP_043537138.1 leucine zipper putative tumor suppressor 1-like [Chiloscyllium plagiosum]